MDKLGFMSGDYPLISTISHLKPSPNRSETEVMPTNQAEQISNNQETNRLDDTISAVFRGTEMISVAIWGK